MFSGNFAPQGWLMCEGQALSIAQYDTLYTIVGTSFGGDGVNTFNLPDLRCRIAVGTGQGNGLPNYVLGEMAGSENVSLSVNNLPPHTHTLPVMNVTNDIRIRTSDNVANALSGKGNALAKAVNALSENPSLTPQIYDKEPSFNESNTMNSDSIDVSGLSTPAVNTSVSGSNLPISTVQPYLAINFIICVEGIYPSQN